MKYNIYETSPNGRELIGTCDVRAMEQIRAGFRNMEFEPIDEELPLVHPNAVDSAKNLLIALAIGATGIILTIVTELVTK